MEKMNQSAQPTEEQSREVAESARETEWTAPSFGKGLFLGRFNVDTLFPLPEQSSKDKEEEVIFLSQLKDFLETQVNADEIDRTGQIPQQVIEGLAKLGAFGIKIPKEYGGLGLSQLAYGRAAKLIARYDGSIAALVSAHQSIGVPQPIKMFGTKAQKEKYLPRLAKGEISAFALTEHGVGSDPAALSTTAVPSEDGEHFIINGEKLWCTNGTIANLLVVMARTPSKMKNGKEIPQITAFVVERDTPGISLVHRCRFMGLKAIENGVLHFDNVKVPRENIILGEGKGLKLALMTLNTGRLTIPMCVAGMGKECIEISKEWARDRVQWGAPVGKHDAVAQMVGKMTANTFAVEAMAEVSALLADQAKNDIRLEAAIAKLWTTEVGWEMIDDCLQIRGGRGYETADSLRARGEAPHPVERMLRDFRINRIFEGSSEIMRLFIAREAVDKHLQLAGALIDKRASLGEKGQALAKSAAFYSVWLPSLMLPSFKRHSEFGRLSKYIREVEGLSKKLGRNIFWSMLRFGPKLEKKQAVLGRLVDIGCELFAMTCACVRAVSTKDKEERKYAEKLAAVFCEQSLLRVDDLFHHLWHNADDATYKLAQDVLEDKYQWLEK